MKKLYLVLLLWCLVFSSLSAKEDPFSYPLNTLILDAGHGGHDPGAVQAWSFAGGTVYERDLTLDITKRLHALLCVSHPELHIVLTRSDDTYLSLDERCALANSLILEPRTSSLFLSIHVNSAQSREASGFEVLTKKQEKRVEFLDENTPLQNLSLFSSHSLATLNRLLNNRNLVVATTFAQTLSERMVTMRDRGVKERDLHVLNVARMPSVLVEVGFLSNEEDARNLVSPQWRQHVAQALALAVERCLGEDV